MSLKPQDQFKKFLEDSKEVLIMIPENPSGDAVGSAWALYYFLEKRGLVPTIVLSNHFSPKYSFLPKPERTIEEILGARDFVLSFDITNNKITHARTEEKDNRFNIYLTPEKGSIDPRDFSFILAQFKYNLIIVLNSPDLEKLGKVYESNPDLFFEVPIINIDHKSNNENFGQINLIDILSSSTCEILSGLMEEFDAELIDEKVANCLLSGIISATDSFKKKNTTPKTLLVAASLMDKGANQQEIIRWLYKTQPLNILKLWGRAMAKLKWNEKARVVWTELSVEDFVQSRTNPADTVSILEKLCESYSEAKIFMALRNDTPASSIVQLQITHFETAKRVHALLGGTLHGDIIEFTIDSENLSQAGEDIAKKLEGLEL